MEDERWAHGYQDVLDRLCPRCRGVVRANLDRIEAKIEASREERARLREAMEAQRAEAGELAASLLKLPRDEQVSKAQRTKGRLWHRPLIEELLRRAALAVHDDPELGLHLADLALLLAPGLLHPGKLALAGGRAGHSDVVAASRAARGNALRVLCRLDEASEEFGLARQNLRLGSGDVLLRANLLSMQASLLLALGEGAKGVEQLEEAATIFESAGEDHLRGRVMVMMAAARATLGDLPAALAAHIESCALVDEDRDPCLAAAVFLNMSRTYSELGRFPEALRVLEVGDSALRRGEGMDRSLTLHRHWTRSRALVGLGSLEEAASLLEKAAAGFRQMNKGLSEARVLLDLAEVHLAAGRLEALLVLVTRVHEAVGGEVDRQAQVALTVLLQAVAGERSEDITEALRKCSEAMRRLPACTRHIN